MKTFLTLSVLLMLNSFNLIAQWQPDVRLTNNSAGSYTSNNNAWNIAANGNAVHVVWMDDRDGNYEIYHKSSTDEGLNWGTDTRLTNNSATSWAPSVALFDQTVHVVWYEERDGNQEIYFKNSFDGGTNWGADIRLTNNSASSIYPSLAVSDQFVHVVWYDTRNFYNEIFYKQSTDGGMSWGEDTQLTSATAGAYVPSIAVSDSVVHVVWRDDTSLSNQEIYYKRSTDGGTNWGEIQIMPNTSGDSHNPSVAVSDSNAHIIWRDDRDGNFEKYYKHSTDAGINWGEDTRLTNDPAVSENPSISVSGHFLHIVWYETRDGNTEIYYKRSTDGGLSWEEDLRLTNNFAGSGRPSVSVSGSKVHVVWYDYRDGSEPEIYYKRNPTGNVTGIENIGLDFPEEFMLEQNYPNPFNPSTTIQYAIPDGGFVTLKVYDVLGNELATLVNEEKYIGSYEVDFTAAGLSSGIYFYKLQAGSFVETKKMILIR